jgi:hypothetical protein
MLLVALPVLAALLIGAGLAVVRARSDTGTTAATGADPVIAQVGPDTVHQSLFDQRLSVVLVAVAQGGGPQKSDPQYPAFLSQVRARVLKNLILDTLIMQQARARNVATTDAEVASEVQIETAAAGGQNQLATQLAEAGGSLATLRDETRSRLNEAHLEEVWAQDRINEAIARLHAAARFEDVAADFSDDAQTNAKGGAVGSLSLDQLHAGDAAFAGAVLALQSGQTSPQPVRDDAGFEIVRLDSISATARSIHRILVAAPRPYTAKERPAWFTQAVLLALSQVCASNSLSVSIDTSLQPCGLDTPTPAGTSSPGLTPRPVPSGPTGGTPTP